MKTPIKIPIVETDNYLLIVSDEKIKEKDYYLDDTMEIRRSVTSDDMYWSARKHYLLITGYYPLRNTSPTLEDVVLLPGVLTIPNGQTVYSEEDVYDIIDLAAENKGLFKEDILKQFQSIKKPLLLYPKFFIPEMEFIVEERTGTELAWGRSAMKTLINEQGQTRFVGTYEY